LSLRKKGIRYWCKGKTYKTNKRIRRNIARMHFESASLQDLIPEVFD